MYTRNFRDAPLQIPENYGGTAFGEEKEAAFSAKQEYITEIPEKASKSDSPPDETDEKQSLPFNLGIETGDSSDILLIVLVLLLMKEGNGDTELPLILLILLIAGSKN